MLLRMQLGGCFGEYVRQKHLGLTGRWCRRVRQERETEPRSRVLVWSWLWSESEGRGETLDQEAWDEYCFKHAKLEVSHT